MVNVIDLVMDLKDLVMDLKDWDVDLVYDLKDYGDLEMSQDVMKSWFSSMLISWSHVVFKLMSCCDCVISCCCIVISCFVNIVNFVNFVISVIYRVLQHHHNCIVFHVSFIYDFGQGWFCYLRSIWMIWNYLNFLHFLFLLCFRVICVFRVLTLFKVPTLETLNFAIFGDFGMLAIYA